MTVREDHPGTEIKINPEGIKVKGIKLVFTKDNNDYTTDYLRKNGIYKEVSNGKNVIRNPQKVTVME